MDDELAVGGSIVQVASTHFVSEKGGLSAGSDSSTVDSDRPDHGHRIRDGTGKSGGSSLFMELGIATGS